nr:helix-turn-helix domain-containing protein [Anaerotignum lactatifermentans]
MIKKRQPNGTTKEEIDEDLQQTLIMKLLKALPQF